MASTMTACRARTAGILSDKRLPMTIPGRCPFESAGVDEPLQLVTNPGVDVDLKSPPSSVG